MCTYRVELNLEQCPNHSKALNMKKLESITLRPKKCPLKNIPDL